jgi:hypothetical protein
MNEPTRASDQTKDMMLAKNAGDKLVTALAELSQWKMEITGDVESGGSLKITVRKHNGQGFIKLLTKEQVVYFKDDKEAFIQQMAFEIYDLLLKDQIVKSLEQPIRNGIENVIKVWNLS